MRAEIANREQADLFISIHTNWNKKNEIRGFEIYIPRQGDKVATLKGFLSKLYLPSSNIRSALYYLLEMECINRSREFAGCVKDSFRKLDTPDRGIREARFQVLRRTVVPAVLIELDYISNAQGEKLLGSAAYRDKLAELIAEGINKYRLSVK
jgi:N-acetylmuramoyl-L-alanine amidase